MRLFKRVGALQRHLDRVRGAGASVGFVPTMGALHEGHVALLRRSMRENEHTVCSIFVNPTQFNDPEDLVRYPRMPEKDIATLLRLGCEVLFMPPESEIYPQGEDTPSPPIDLQGLDATMEGIHRPGHFEGVVQVVHRLLDIVQPHRLYMGQKDYQQFVIVQHMIRQLGLPVQLVMCPIVREADGLAMSSRNLRLSAEARAAAPRIYQTLSEVRARLSAEPAAALTEVAQWARRRLDRPPLRVEYFEIVDGTTLRPLTSLAEADTVVACTAVWAGEVRLIDNVILKGEGERGSEQGAS